VLRHGDCVIAHRSAAWVHGLPLFHPVADEVSLLVPEGHWAGRRAGIAFHRGSVTDGEVVHLQRGVRAPVPVTTPVRTWLDVARTRPLADALTLGDAAARSGHLGVAELRREVEGLNGVRGCRRAKVAAAHLSPLRETPLESGSWAYFVRHRLRLPRMQVTISDKRGSFVGRVDFLWADAGVVGECDGMVKYDSRDVLYAEKRREDALRTLGLRVVRWGWRDLADDRLAGVLRAQVR